MQAPPVADAELGAPEPALSLSKGLAIFETWVKGALQFSTRPGSRG